MTVTPQGDPTEAQGTHRNVSPANEIEPDLERARRTANMAHGIVVKLQEMGLPEALYDELSSLCTDLGDLWGAEKALAERLEILVSSDGEWESVGDHLVDLRATVDHIRNHAEGVEAPIDKIARFAYDKAAESTGDV